MYVLSEFNITIVKITSYSYHLYGSEINNLKLYTIFIQYVYIIIMMFKGKEKLQIHEAVKCKLVLEEDGSEIDDTETLLELQGSRIMLLSQGQLWFPVTELSTSEIG